MNWTQMAKLWFLLVAILSQTAAAQTTTSLSPQAVESWADKLFDKTAQEKRFSGAVVSFVQNGKLVFAKGYGYADLAAGTPVDPATTTFRIGSISKTFTATAIAQLLDRGLIKSLDEPVNQYLKRLQLPSPDGKPITIRQLITHTAGFESRAFNIATDKTLELPLSADVVESFMAELVNEPGRYASYNNFGTAVLGLLVEDVSGIQIADYFERNIFQPLGMSHSVLNMSPDPTPGLGASYGFLPNGQSLLIQHRTVHPFHAPIGGINSTAVDMAKYMLAHLDAGFLSTAPLMSPAALSMMHTRLAGNHQLSSGFGMIFFTWDWNDQHMILHGGDWPGTHSGMVLFPELNAGLFFSLMADFPELPVLESITGSKRLEPVTGVQVEPPLTNVGVITNFLTHFFGRLKLPLAQDFKASDLKEYTGNYVGQSAPSSTMEVMLNFTNPLSTVRVETSHEGGLMINGKGPYREIAPDVFWSDNVQTPLDGFFLDSPLYLFSRDRQGAVEYLTPHVGFDVWVRKGILETPSTYAILLVIIFLFLISGLLCLLYPKVPGKPLVKWLPSLITLSLIAMPGVLLLGYGEQESLVNELLFGHTKRFVWFAVLAHVVLILGLLSAWHSIQSWRNGYWAHQRLGWFMRIHYTALSLATLLLIPVFSFSNLLGI